MTFDEQAPFVGLHSKLTWCAETTGLKQSKLRHFVFCPDECDACGTTRFDNMFHSACPYPNDDSEFTEKEYCSYGSGSGNPASYWIS